jgi:cell division protein ZapA (FtsZ GTPase activity inhibitor)
MQLREDRPGLRDIDLAVMSALRIASKLQAVEEDFKENIFALKSGVEDALGYIEQVSPGTVASEQTH